MELDVCSVRSCGDDFLLHEIYSLMFPPPLSPLCSLRFFGTWTFFAVVSVS